MHRDYIICISKYSKQEATLSKVNKNLFCAHLTSVCLGFCERYGLIYGSGDWTSPATYKMILVFISWMYMAINVT